MDLLLAAYCNIVLFHGCYNLHQNTPNLTLLVFFCDIYAAIIYIAAYIHYAKMILNEFVLYHRLFFNTGNTNSQVPLRPPRKEFGSKPMPPLPLQSPFKGI